MAYEDGPFIQVACFCDQIIEDKSGSLSLIRIIDTLTHTEGGPNPPRDLPTFTYDIKLVLSLKAGNARGRSELRIVPELPTGEAKEPIVLTVHFEGEEKGQNVIANLHYEFTMEGLYWYDIYIEETRLTRIPLRVKYNRVIAGRPQQL